MPLRTTIKQWPSTERPREKLLKSGADCLSDAELLALFIQCGIKGYTAVDIARAILQQFGSLRRLFQVPLKQLCNVSGLGQARAALLHAALELGQRYQREVLIPDDVVTDSATTRQFIASQLRDKSQEIFACLFLNTRNHILAFEQLFFGTINMTTVHPREIIKRALAHNAASIILAHNHPSGLAQPSLADKEMTQNIQQILHTIDVVLLDHVIVGDGETTSFAELGLL
ncbi:MAG: DNA repair protein RadC [Gammaproteobacteria bacterium]